ncbi:MAG TPA: c-type cytochrome [Myxococcaceae bacterium]|nr:c-type cytochrome [Myxococcaceae bacterium]
MSLKRFAAAALFAGSLATAAFADDAGDLWKAKCKGCHGDDGKAKTKVGEKEKIPDFTTEKWQKEMADGDIKKVITDGSDANSKMKPFKEKLSEQEIDSLVKYIRTLKGK